MGSGLPFKRKCREKKGGWVLTAIQFRKDPAIRDFFLAWLCIYRRLSRLNGTKGNLMGTSTVKKDLSP